jgi:hypothetical protein
MEGLLGAAAAVLFVWFITGQWIRTPVKIDGNFREWLDEMRREDGDIVSFFPNEPNHKDFPRCMIEVSGDWTSHFRYRYSGDTLEECLESAVRRRRATESGQG